MHKPGCRSPSPRAARSLPGPRRGPRDGPRKFRQQHIASGGIEPAHYVATAGQAGDREPVAHRLAEGSKIRKHSGNLLVPAQCVSKPGNDLVEYEKSTLTPGDLTESSRYSCVGRIAPTLCGIGSRMTAATSPCSANACSTDHDVVELSDQRRLQDLRGEFPSTEDRNHRRTPVPRSRSGHGVMPWNPPCTLMMLRRPVSPRARRRAWCVASLPLVQATTISADGTTETTFSAKRTSRSVTPIPMRSASSTDLAAKALTPGSLWPNRDRTERRVIVEVTTTVGVPDVLPVCPHKGIRPPIAHVGRVDTSRDYPCRPGEQLLP